MRGGLVGSADGPHHHRLERPLALPRPPDLGPLATIPPPSRTTDRGPGSRPGPDRSATQPMHLAAARRLPRLLPLAIAVALLGAGLVLAAGDPAAAQAPQSKATIDGTAAFKWEPANVTVRPGGTVTFEISGGPPHPVISGDGS